MRVGIIVAQVPFLRDGARVRAEELTHALHREGHEAEIISVPFNGRPDCRLTEQMLACRLLDLDESMGTRIDRVIGLTFPAYLVPHATKVIWLLGQCRDAYDLWQTPYATLHAAPDADQVRHLVRDADACIIPRARGVFTPSRSATERLRADCGISSEPLQAPPYHAELYQHADEGNFFLMPTQDGSPLREELVLEAMQRTRYPVRMQIISNSAGQQRLPVEAVLGARVTRTAATGEKRRKLLGTCLAVVLTPLGEPDGMTTMHAMLSEKAVITSKDAGAVAELVHDGQTGFVCPPEPERFAEALDRLWEDRALARRLGRAACASYQELGLQWDIVLERLLAA